MSIQVHQFACLIDNYGFLIRDPASGRVACVDTPDGDRIIAEAKALGWSIDYIFNTHWHPDHAGGNAAVKAATGAYVIAPAEVSRTGPVDRIVSAGDTISLGNSDIVVLGSGGHTLGHITFYAPQSGVVFVGDTLFPMGCGRLFEGTADQMWQSLSALAALPDDTLVYCAHEYTLSNARFALAVDDDAAVAERVRSVEILRSKGIPTVPTTIGEERRTNPFLRAPILDRVSGVYDPVAAFAKMRLAKDEFRAE